MSKLKSAVLYEYLTKVRAIGIFGPMSRFSTG